MRLSASHSCSRRAPVSALYCSHVVHVVSFGFDQAVTDNMHTMWTLNPSFTPSLELYAGQLLLESGNLYKQDCGRIKTVSRWNFPRCAFLVDICIPLKSQYEIKLPFSRLDYPATPLHECARLAARVVETRRSREEGNTLFATSSWYSSNWLCRGDSSRCLSPLAEGPSSTRGCWGLRLLSFSLRRSFTSRVA